jgi:hypothetical protein
MFEIKKLESDRSNKTTSTDILGWLKTTHIRLVHGHNRPDAARSTSPTIDTTRCNPIENS